MPSRLQLHRAGFHRGVDLVAGAHEWSKVTNTVRSRTWKALQAARLAEAFFVRDTDLHGAWQADEPSDSLNSASGQADFIGAVRLHDRSMVRLLRTVAAAMSCAQSHRDVAASRIAPGNRAAGLPSTASVNM